MVVALAIILFVFLQSNKITVKDWAWEPGQLPVECDPPQIVPPEEITILVPYGSVFYAAAPMFEEQLPEVSDASRHAVVIIGLRGETDVGSTFLEVLARYARSLDEQESKLMLTGVDQNVRDQIERTGVIQDIGRENIFLATEELGRALLDAEAAAEAWIAAQDSGTTGDGAQAAQAASESP